MRQLYTFEASLEVEMAAVDFKFCQAVLVAAEYILEVDVLQVVVAADICHVGEAFEDFDHFDMWPVGSGLNHVKIVSLLLDYYTHLFAQLSHL